MVNYSQVVFALIGDFVLFDRTIGWLELLGAALVVGSNLSIALLKYFAIIK